MFQGVGRCSVCCGVGLSHKDHRFKRKKKRNRINSLSEGQQRAPWHMRKRRHEKGQFLKHKRKEKKKKDQSGVKSEQVSASGLVGDDPSD